MRNSVCAATFRIYHQQRVKHMTTFFGAAVYPLYIRVSCGTRSLNFKSRCFDQLLHPKYQNSVYLGNKAPLLSEVIRLETIIIESIISKQEHGFSLPGFKKQYDAATVNLLDKLDEEYKEYMVNFFFEEGMPSIAYLLKSFSSKLTADVILHDLSRSLSRSVYRKMISTSTSLKLPYIPLLQFSEQHCSGSAGILLVHHFYQENFTAELDAFVQAQFPQYYLHHPFDYLVNCMEGLAVQVKE